MALKKVIFTEKQIYDYLYSKIKNHYGVSGLLGNIRAESNLKPTNLQNTYERKFGLSDDEYTNQVDNGVYTNFVRDSAGYGLAQWTYWSRKENLYNYCKERGASIGCCETQLEFLIKELQAYGLLDDLQNAKSIKEASDIILLKFEKPADQGESVKNKRCSFGQEFYNKYATASSTTTTTTTTSSGNNGGKVMTNLEFVEILKKLVNTPTVYMYGAWGQPVSESFIQQKAKQYPSWYTSDKINMLRKHIGKSFGFDCVNMIKSILWGFSFDMNQTNGGAKYGSNGVIDTNADGMIANCCSTTSTDFSKIEVGSVVWIKGHIGVYIGNGQVIECTPKWSNNVQYSNLGNIGNKDGNFRNWSKWGKLKYINYIEDKKEESKPIINPTPVAPKPTTPTNKFKLGDVVMFVGNTHYTSSNSTNAKACKPGKATITQIYNGKHPYHLIRVSGQGSTVYGWVDEKDIESLVKEETYRTHTVQKGQTLWGIAQQYLGQGKRYTEIMNLNGLKTTTINVGQVLKIPNK